MVGLSISLTVAFAGGKHPIDNHALRDENNGRWYWPAGQAPPRGTRTGSERRVCMLEQLAELHWTIVGIPFVIVGGILVFYLLHKHKEKKSTEHMLKLD
jgi:hypothetical protein